LKKTLGTIEQHISSPEKCDSWIIYATENSLANEKCKEELYYALDRALKIKSGNFSIIWIFPNHINPELIPPSIKTRLYVSLEDENWLERVVSWINWVAPSIVRPTLEEFDLRVQNYIWRSVIEVRPRAWTWSPFFCAIPIWEKKELNPRIAFNSKWNDPNWGWMLYGKYDYTSRDWKWSIIQVDNQATPTMSCFITVNKLPTELLFWRFNPNLIFSKKF
jgi:hypothetical protein